MQIAQAIQRYSGLLGTTAQYSVSFAVSAGDVRACQMLRYQVFNLELNEGLASAHLSGLDKDRFDSICDHLMVTDENSGTLVGTYRMQTGENAARNLGYYCEQFFQFAPFESIRSRIMELGRACVHRDHRNANVLYLLWKGIAARAAKLGIQFVVGCSSLTSQDEAAGLSLYNSLITEHLVEPQLRTQPHAIFECHPGNGTSVCPQIPKLFRAYLGLSAKICGPPAIDCEFKTIDFLTILDLNAIPDRLKRRFLAEST